MPIYDISASKGSSEEATKSSSAESYDEVVLPFKDRFFSSLTTRILFTLLLIADLFWALWSVIKTCVMLPIFALLLFKPRFLKKRLLNVWLNLKRAGICGVALVIALFSPSLGIMIACTYFLMYDKAGIQEVVPTSLQDQFKDFLKESN
jgi:hypothetical protein